MKWHALAKEAEYQQIQHDLLAFDRVKVYVIEKELGRGGLSRTAVRYMDLRLRQCQERFEWREGYAARWKGMVQMIQKQLERLVRRSAERGIPRGIFDA